MVLMTLGFFLMFVFLIGSVTAAGSSSEAKFNIPGCTFQFDDSFIGVSVGGCSVGENEFGDYGGWFYCNEDRGGYITTEVGQGCSRGSGTYESGTALGACCPNNFPYCAETGEDTGLFECKERMANCFADMTEDDCSSPQVDGYYYSGAEGDEKCICVRSEQSCSVYTNEFDCNGDAMNIGSVGAGRSEYCGGYFSCDNIDYSVPIDSCGCSWNGDSCDHSITAVETFPDIPNAGIEFGCSSSYSIDSECIDGGREVSWFSNSFGDDVLPECLAILGCDAGTDVLACGEDFVKLPGFSLFSLFMALFVIGIYYFVLGTVKRKESFSHD